MRWSESLFNEFKLLIKHSIVALYLLLLNLVIKINYLRFIIITYIMQISYKNCIILIATLSLLAGVSCANDDIYKCADNLKLDTCYLKVDGDSNKDIPDTKYVTDCGKGKICANAGESYKCVKRANLLEEGDKCKFDQECKTGKCNGEKCSYLADNEKCDGHENCGLNSSCVDVDGVDKCTAMIAEGESCGGDVKGECKAGLVCGKVGEETASTCKKR